MTRRTQPLPGNWSRLRSEQLTRDGHRCAKCGDPATHVDHIVPAWEGGSDHPSNLRSLCEGCHNRKTGKEGQKARAEYRRRARRHDPAPWEPVRRSRKRR